MPYPIRLMDIDPFVTVAATFVGHRPINKRSSKRIIQEKDELTVQAHQLICLTRTCPGRYFTIVSVRADPVLARRLLWLGLFEGSTWEIRHRGIDGTVILSVANQPLTLKVKMASCIWGRQSASPA